MLVTVCGVVDIINAVDGVIADSACGSGVTRVATTTGIIIIIIIIIIYRVNFVGFWIIL